MLEPQDRRQLLDSLRPPKGYSLDFAVGTTYSLDLLALLTAPLAFTFFDWEDEQGRPTIDPQALLVAAKRSADKISIFCQAGQIAVPAKHHILYNYLEGSVFQVTPRSRHGVFHPKVWVLRYVATGQPVIYRLLCLSRNLTFDRSWDSVLVLDGQLTDRTRIFARNKPLSSFVAALPKLAIRPVPERVLEMLTRIRREILKVQFELPEGFHDARFWPLGIAGAARWPFKDRIDRMLVISPFVSPTTLNLLNQHGEDNILVSRVESLATLSRACLDKFKKIYCLSPGAEPEEEATDAGDQSNNVLSGLHAKTYVTDGGRYSRVWTGSANATDAAFNGNIEFLTELIGTNGQCGIDTVLAEEKGHTKFIALLEEFTPTESPEPEDKALKRLEKRIQEAKLAIAKSGLTARISTAETPKDFAVALVRTAGALALPTAVTVRCWPISLPDSSAVTLSPAADPFATFGPLSLLALTSFFAFEVSAECPGKSISRSFVLNLPMENPPADRSEETLKALLQNRDQVLQFLLLLLFAEGDDDDTGGLLGTASIFTGHNWGPNGAMPLLETILRALDRAPEKIDEAARIIEDLRKTPSGRQLLPEGFDSIWEPIRTIRAKSLK